VRDASTDHEPSGRQSDDVITTEDTFDAAGFGAVPGVTTYLHGALIGMEVRINTSAWPGYTEAITANERSDCVQPLNTR